MSFICILLMCLTAPIARASDVPPIVRTVQLVSTREIFSVHSLNHKLHVYLFYYARKQISRAARAVRAWLYFKPIE